MKKLIYNLTLVIVPLLAGLSVYSAFLGAARAQTFFNSLPVIVHWFFVVILIIASVLSFKNLHKPHLLLIHLGIVLVFLGSMLSSERAHEISGQVFKHEKPAKSQMIIYEGQSAHELYQRSTNTAFQLPFQIHLKDFIVENYTPLLIIKFPDGQTRTMPAQLNDELILDGDITKIHILNLFENLKITLEDGQRKVTDSEGPGRNPAVEIEITKKDGSVCRQYVFELFQGHVHSDVDLQFKYYQPIKDYISRVDVIKNGVVITSADIEVNHPLHFSGFHFYQHKYDSVQHQYTVLQVVSDSGLNVVYAGYALLVAGVVWYFWFIRLRRC